MIRKVFLLPLLAGMVLFSACSLPTREEDTPQAPAHSTGVQPAQPIKPREVELTSELLFDLMVAELAGQRGSLGVAAHNYLKTARKTRDARLARRATHFAIYAQDHDTALEGARLWVELAPDENEAQQSFAAMLIRRGDVDEAYPYLEKIITSNKNGKQSGLLIVAGLLGRDSDKERALDTMNRLIKPMSHDPHALYAYASLANSVGHQKEALETLEQLMERHGESRIALVLQAKIMSAQDNQKGALDSIARAVELEPDNHQLRLTYARMLVNQQQLPEAREQFRTLGKQAPHNGDILYALGLLAMQARDFDEAEILFKQLLALKQHRDEAFFSLGEIAEIKEQTKQAIEWYESVGKGKLLIDARLRAALIINREEGVAAAREYLHTIPTHVQTDAVRLIMLEGELLNDAGQNDAAMEVYSEGLSRYPDEIRLLFARGMQAESLNHLEIMEQDLRQILKQEPDNIQVLNALGYTLADRTLRYQEAYEYIRRALEQSPDDPAIIDSMGWVLYRLGRHQESLKYLRRAANMKQDGEISAHLGEVLWAAGNKDEARAIWKEALKLEPDHKYLRQVIDRYLQ